MTIINQRPGSQTALLKDSEKPICGTHRNNNKRSKIVPSPAETSIHMNLLADTIGPLKL
jgi:hypothetical protein